ncbi:hypothetical protein ACIBSW_35310 [Actinoplanes sp. NPDC049668]|uniref:WXG100 family type VII secretion target n=1 Tax=unclassified Actinoplanes TaxID=2626549 RepID=UPI0033AD137F
MAENYYGYSEPSSYYSGISNDYVQNSSDIEPYSPTNWDGKTIEEMWEMVRKESDERAFALAAMWNRTSSLLEATRGNLQRHADALRAKWSSAAGDIFMQKVGAALYSIDEWKKIADDNARGLEQIGNKISNTQRDLKPLWEEYLAKQASEGKKRADDEGFQGSDLIDWLPGVDGNDGKSHEDVHNEYKQRFLDKVKPLAETYIDVYISNISRAGKYKGPTNAVVANPGQVPTPSRPAPPGAPPPGARGAAPNRPTLPGGAQPPPPPATPGTGPGAPPAGLPDGLSLAGGAVAAPAPPAPTAPSVSPGPAPTPPPTPAVPAGFSGRPGVPPTGPAPGRPGAGPARPSLPGAGGGGGAPGARGPAPSKPTLPGSTQNGPGNRPGAPGGGGARRGGAPSAPRLPGSTAEGAGRPGTPRTGAPGGRGPQSPNLGGKRGTAPGAPGSPSTGANRPGSPQLGGRGGRPGAPGGPEAETTRTGRPGAPGTGARPSGAKPGPVGGKPDLAGRAAEGTAGRRAPATGPNPALGGRRGASDVPGQRRNARGDGKAEGAEWAYGEDDELWMTESETVSVIETPAERRPQEQGRVLGHD